MADVAPARQLAGCAFVMNPSSRHCYSGDARHGFRRDHHHFLACSTYIHLTFRHARSQLLAVVVYAVATTMVWIIYDSLVPYRR